MKSRIASLVCAAMLFGVAAHAQINTDPLVAGAVTAGDQLVSRQLSKINDKKEAIATAEAGILASLEVIREYEDKTFKYLKTVNGVIHNAYDIGRCGKLAEQIADNLKKCTQAAKDHPQGALVSTIVSNRYTTIIAESTALVSYIGNLVTKGGERNLLNSAERNRILSTITGRLAMINRQLVGLRYNIELYRWTDVIRINNPVEWYDLIDAQNTYMRAKKNIEQLAEAF